MANIDIAGLDKAKVLAALYNHAKPLGMGLLHYNPDPMTVETAQELLGGGVMPNGIGSHYGKGKYFDYLQGRVMKVDIGGDTLNPNLYDRDNGEGAAAKAIDSIR